MVKSINYMNTGKIRLAFKYMACAWLILLLLTGYVILWPIVFVKYLITGKKIEANSKIGRFITNTYKKANELL